jgi:ankyrin repeat protein
MDHSESRVRLFLFRLIPTIMVVSFIAWCSSGGRERKEVEPIRAELMELFMSEGLIDNPTSSKSLADIAKKNPQSTMNRLLYTAAPTASLAALQWIINNGADPKNVGTVKDRTLLQQVAKVPRFDRLDYFLSLGLDPMERSRDGLTLLHIAAEGGLDEKVLKLLLGKGLDLNATTPDGATAMHFASVKSIPVLVSVGMPVDALDASQRTALHYAASKGNNEIAAELIRNNASVFVQDKKGRTPLHLATMSRSNTVVDTLLAAGAPRTLRDIDGNTPRDVYQDSLRNRNRNDYRGSSGNLLDKL